MRGHWCFLGAKRLDFKGFCATGDRQIGLVVLATLCFILECTGMQPYNKNISLFAMFRYGIGDITAILSAEYK
jgi:hypothetical protein